MSALQNPPRQISQETFDSVIQENIEDFGMTKDAALSDAIEQFKMQGVSLSNIDVTGGIGREEILGAIGKIKDPTCGEEDLLIHLKTLSDLCSETFELSERNLNLVNSNEVMYPLICLLNVENPSVVSASLRTLSILTKRHVGNRDRFEPGGCTALCKTVTTYAFEIDDNIDNSDIVLNSMRLSRTIVKSEYNKLMMMQNGMGKILSRLVVEKQPDGEGGVRHNILVEACNLIRGLCVHDDTRKEMSCAYDNGKFFLVSEFVRSDGEVLKTFKVLFSFAKLFKDVPLLASASLAAAKQLITSEEAVKVATHHGAMELPLQILSWPESPMSLMRSIAGLMRNMCADDDRKNRLVSDGSMALLVSALSMEKMVQDVSFCEHGIASLAAMTLRSPTNSTKIVRVGAIDVIVKAMRRHSEKGNVQRQACLALRNIAARCPDLRSTMLDAGVEPVLRSAGLLQDALDEAYGALRDLGCEVQMVKISAEGTVEAAVEHFGVGKNKAFKQVYDEAPDISRRIEDDSTAPFACGGMFEDTTLDHVYTHDHSSDSSKKCCSSSDH